MTEKRVDSACGDTREAGAETRPFYAYEALGAANASWVTFVPGIGNDRSFWREPRMEIARTHQTLALDLWGHGDSPPPPKACSFASMVDDIARLWDALGVARSYLVGLGFGGSLSLATAIAHPSRVAGVVAFCCRPRLPDDRREFWRGRRNAAAEIGMAAMADQTVDRWLSEDFKRRLPAVDLRLRTSMKRTSLAGYQACVDAFIEMDFSQRLSGLSCPVQLVAAEFDHGGGPIPDMQAMQREIPGAALTIIHGCGHVCAAEAPDQTSKTITEFLSRCASSDG